MRLENKIALITGVGTGMGRQAALTFTREGACVIGCDINVPKGEDCLEQVTRAGGKAIFFRCDVGDEAQVASVVQRGVAHYGKLDILYNNAGIGPPTDTHAADLPLEVWEWVMRINATGTFLCSKHAIPHLVANGGGSVINIASTAGVKGGTAIPITAYGSSKAAVLGLTKQLAAQYAKYKVRVNALLPGPIDTPILDPFLGDANVKQAFSVGLPLGRMGVPDDVVNLALYLASDESSYMTGAWILIDGGMTTV
jgi:NAD(P)-dependent dehydrogenase (short-subunit alcohol dehydrogenase family)